MSKDDVPDAAEMRAFVGAEYVILADPEGVAVKSYGVNDLLGDGLAAPSTFIVGSDGIVRWAFVSNNETGRPTAALTLEHVINTVPDQASSDDSS